MSDQGPQSTNLLAILAAVIVIGCLAALLIALTVRAVEAIV